ncbi:MAG: hypothetical protein IKH95_11110 [Bacteroidaceae bacterium]|nr:hypothetical protein [Bacteroidaceae bacterium]
MKKASIYLLGAALLLVALFIWSYCMVPLSVEGSLTLACAKLWAQGYQPWTDFQWADCPLGLGIMSLVYCLGGINTSGYWFLELMCGLHLLNLFLLYLAMEHCKISTTGMLLGLIFYLMVLFSLNGLEVNLQPFAVCFGLLSLLALQKGHTVCSAVWLGVSLLTMEHAILLLPAMLLLAYWKTDASFIKYVGVLVAVFLVGYIAVAVLTGQPGWILQLDLFTIDRSSRLFTRESNLVIQVARLSFFFLFLVFVYWDEVALSVRQYCIVAWVVLGCMAAFMLLRTDMAIGMLALPWMALALGLLVTELSDKKWVAVVWVAVFLLPAFLMLREGKKLQFGQVRTEQRANLAELEGLFPKPTLTVPVFLRSSEYAFGPQVYSEVPNLVPVDLLHPQKEGEDRAESLWRQIKEADVVLMELNAFLHLNNGYNDELWEALGDRTERSVGNFMLMER